MKLTAGELIEELKKVPPDTEVSFQMNDGCCSDYMDLEFDFHNIETYNPGTKREWNSCQIRMCAIRGYTSCIKAGATKRFLDELYGDKK